MANAVLETKILDAMKEHFIELDKQDERLNNAINEGKVDPYCLKMLNHGYSFRIDLKNIISVIMYKKLYSAWEPAHCGYKGRRGTPGYAYSQLNDKEISIINIVFDRMVTKGYLKLSKSGMKAKLVK